MGKYNIENNIFYDNILGKTQNESETTDLRKVDEENTNQQEEKNTGICKGYAEKKCDISINNCKKNIRKKCNQSLKKCQDKEGEQCNININACISEGEKKCNIDNVNDCKDDGKVKNYQQCNIAKKIAKEKFDEYVKKIRFYN